MEFVCLSVFHSLMNFLKLNDEKIIKNKLIYTCIKIRSFNVELQE